MAQPVVIAPYSAQWPRVFERERERLQGAFAGEAAAIEHIGSTAVPGLGAKPTVDILLGAPSLEAIVRRIPALEALGYRYVPEFEDVLPQRRYFVSPAQGPSAFHLHAVVEGSPFWADHLAFRDALRADPRLRDEYHALKVRLADRYGADRGAYTDAKAPFIRGVVAARSHPREC